MIRYHVARYVNGEFESIVSGMGKNAGTWDAEHSRSRAYHYARELRKFHAGKARITYRVERA